MIDRSTPACCPTEFTGHAAHMRMHTNNTNAHTNTHTKSYNTNR